MGFNTPIVALTTNVMPKGVTKYRKLRFNPHQAKPIERDKFYQVLAHYLEAADGTIVKQGVQFEIENL